MDRYELCSLILPHLFVDTVYRLYPYSSNIRRLVDHWSVMQVNNSDGTKRTFSYPTYWGRVLYRDLRVIPIFSVNYKQYYLERFDYPLSGKAYQLFYSRKKGLIERPLPIRWDCANNVRSVSCFHGATVLARGRLLVDCSHSGRPGMRLPEPMIKVQKGLFSLFLIAQSGRLYEYQHGTIVEVEVPFPVTDITFTDRMFLLSKGKLYEGRRNSRLHGELQTVFGSFVRIGAFENVLQINGDYLLTADGRIHRSTASGIMKCILGEQAYYLRDSYGTPYWLNGNNEIRWFNYDHPRYIEESNRVIDTPKKGERHGAVIRVFKKSVE